MAIFGLLLKSIFLVALMVAVLIIGVVIYLYMRVKRVARTFASAGQQTADAAGQRRRTSGGSSRDAKSSGRSAASSRRNDRGSFAGEELYDERPAHEINRKIFSKDEGEYVDFEEE